jgi:hypothetical protein
LMITDNERIGSLTRNGRKKPYTYYDLKIILDFYLAINTRKKSTT